MLNPILHKNQFIIYFYGLRTSLFRIFIGLLFCLPLVSCTPATQYTAPIREPAIYKSEDYVIYNLEENKTPEDLAEKFLGDARSAWVVEEANPVNNFAKGQVVIIPLKDKNKGGLTSQGYQTIPVLCYHKFAEDCESNLCMPAKVFDQQLKYLKDNGYRTIGPDDLIAFLEYRKALPKKSVWITMDDGYRSVYDIAYPILKKYGFTATFFVYIDFVGVPKTAVSWKHLMEMKEDGFTIGSHTVFHSDLTKKKDNESEQDFLTRITCPSIGGIITRNSCVTGENEPLRVRSDQVVS